MDDEEETRGPGAPAPRFLDGTEPAAAPGISRRQQLARWMTGPGRNMLARTLVNRVWKQLMGRGLVEPVDNVLRPDDGRFADLLEELSETFVAEDYQLVPLVRRVVSTAAYRRRCREEAPGDATRFAFQHGLVRPLSPEVLLDRLFDVTGVTEAGEGREDLADIRASARDQLVSAIAPTPGLPADGLQLAIHDGLYLLNGPTLERLARSGAARLAAGPGTEVESVLERCFGRAGSPGEVAALEAHLATAPGGDAGERTARDRDPASERSRWIDELDAFEGGGGAETARGRAWADVFFAMMTSVEFMVNY